MSLGPSIDPEDPWATGSTGYSPDKLYTRSTNGHDHSTSINVKLSPALRSTADQVIGKIPALRSIGDIVRDALCHRIHAYNAMIAGGINTTPIDTEVRLAEVQDALQKREHWEEFLNNLKTLFDGLARDGDYETMEYFLEENRDVESMTKPYIDRLDRMVDEYEGIAKRLRMAIVQQSKPNLKRR